MVLKYIKYLISFGFVCNKIVCVVAHNIYFEGL